MFMVYNRDCQATAHGPNPEPQLVFVNKCYRAQPLSFIHILCPLSCYNFRAEYDIRPAKPKVYAIWSFVEKVYWPSVYSIVIIFCILTLSCDLAKFTY